MFWGVNGPAMENFEAILESVPCQLPANILLRLPAAIQLHIQALGWRLLLAMTSHSIQYSLKGTSGQTSDYSGAPRISTSWSLLVAVQARTLGTSYTTKPSDASRLPLARSHTVA